MARILQLAVRKVQKETGIQYVEVKSDTMAENDKQYTLVVLW